MNIYGIFTSGGASVLGEEMDNRSFDVVCKVSKEKAGPEFVQASPTSVLFFFSRCAATFVSL
jgi:hypothetical protein